MGSKINLRRKFIMNNLFSKTKSALYSIILILIINTFIAPPVFSDYNIAVVKTTSERSQFNEVADNFTSTLMQKKGFIIKEYDLKKTEAEDLAKDLQKSNTNLIYAIGDKAAANMTEYTKDIPIIFSMILNYKNPKLKLNNSPKVAGISLEVPAEVTFMQMQMLIPNIKNVGIIYSDKSKEIVDAIVSKQTEFGININTLKIKSADDIEDAFDKLKKNSQALYIVADPAIYNKDTIFMMIEKCKKNKMPFIAFSDNFVKAGALMSISPSYFAIGSQAASIAEKILIDKMSPDNVGVESPIGTFFVINSLTLTEIGITSNEDVLSFADKVYRKDDVEK